MDSFEWNKIFMGVGFALLGVLGINELSKAVFAVPEPTTPGFVVAGVEEAAEGGTTSAPAELVIPDFGTVLPAADVAAGEKVMAKCAQCHTWDKGGEKKVGPNLYGIVGNHHAHMEGFEYSSAMEAMADQTWTYEALYRFLANPKKAIPGTKMAFAGLPKEEDRIDVIAFLRTMADSPVAIPAPNPTAPAPTEGGATAPTEGGAAAPAEGGATPTEPAAPPAEGGAAPAPAAGTPATPAPEPAAPPAEPAAPAAEPAAPPAEAPATPPAEAPATPAGEPNPG